MFQVLTAIFTTCILMGIMGLKFIQKKGYIEESPFQWAFFLLGGLIGLCLFISVTLPSLIFYWIIIGINTLLGTQLLFVSLDDMYLFTLAVSILSFVYILLLTLILKGLAMIFKIPKTITAILEMILVFFSIYLSVQYISNEVIIPVASNSFVFILLSVLSMLIFSGLDRVLSVVDKYRKKKDTPRPYK